MTLSYPDTDLIVYARSEQAARDEALMYGIEKAMFDERITVVTPDSDASVALALSATTPWLNLTDINPDTSANWMKLWTRFGQPTSRPTGFAAVNENYVGAYRKGGRSSGTPG